MPTRDERLYLATGQSLPAPASVPVPPPMMVFPAWGVPGIAPLTPVTTGGSGWWLVDELLVVDGPHGEEGAEFYRVLPIPEFGAALARPGTAGSPEPMEVSVADLWVYLDLEEEGPSTRRVDELEPVDPTAWLRRVGSAHEPPQRREPRPATWLPSMVGRTMRLATTDPATGEVEWTWVRGLSEAINDGHGIAVAVCALPDYWRAAYRRPSKSSTWIRYVAFHRLWTY